MFADVYTLETTWQFQIQQPGGSWQHYSQAEYASESECREQAGRVYGGQVATRIVKITREVMA